MTPAELDELEALANAATPGPWEHGVFDRESPGFVESCGEVVAHAYTGEHGVVAETFRDAHRANAAFIAASRAAVPALVAEVRRLARERDEARGALAHANRVAASWLESTKACAAERDEAREEVRRLTRERDEARANTLSEAAEVRHLLADVERLAREVEALRGYQAKNRALRAEVASERAKALEEAAKALVATSIRFRRGAWDEHKTVAERDKLHDMADGAWECVQAVSALAARDAKGGG